MHPKQLFPAGLCSLLLALPALAQASEPLTIERYIEIVRRANPTAAQIQATKAAANAERRASRQFPDPTFGVGFGHAKTRGSDGEGASERTYSIEQIIPWPGTFSASIRSADRQAEVIEATGEETRWQLEVTARRVDSFDFVQRNGGAAVQHQRKPRQPFLNLRKSIQVQSLPTGKFVGAVARADGHRETVAPGALDEFLSLRRVR